MFSKKRNLNFYRLVTFSIVSTLLYPISAVLTPSILSPAQAAPSATATSTTSNLWLNIADSTIATSNVSTSNSTTQWTQITPTSVDDGYSEVISSDQTCSSGTTSGSTCKSTSSSWSFNFAGVNYKKVFFGSNFYITFGNGSGTIPGSLSSLNLPGLMLCGADRYVSKQYYMLDAAGNLRLRMEGYDFQSSFASTPAIFEITLVNGTSTMNVAVGLFTPSPTSGRRCNWASPATASNTSAGLMYSTNPGTTANTLLKDFPTGASLQYTSTIFTTSNGPTLNSSRGLTVSTNVGVTLFDTITASDGTGAITITMDTPTTGASFDTSTGLFQLTRSDSATVTQTFTARDSTNATSTITVTFVVNALPTNTQSNSTLTTTLGRPWQETMTVAGGTAPFTFVKTSSNPQAGITIDTSTTRAAVLRVAATGVAAGTTTETITCTDAVGSVTRAVFTVVVNPAMTLTNPSGYTVNATTGTARVETVTVSGGTPSRSFVLSGSVTSGTISLDTSTAASGYVLLRTTSALAAGTYFETVTATDTRGATAAIGMRVVVASPPVITGSAANFSGSFGTQYFETFTVSGGSLPLSYSLAVTPSNSGITIDSSTATRITLKYANTIASGTYTIVITARDTASATSTFTRTLLIAPPLRWSETNTTTIQTTLGRSTSLRLNFRDGFAGKVFTMTQSTLLQNPGITLDTSTVSSNFVTLNVSNRVGPGTYTVTITGTDTTTARTSTTVTITVNQPLSMNSPNGLIAIGASSMKYNNSSSQWSVLPDSSQYALGSTWTIEWWQYETNTASNQWIFGMGPSTGSRLGIEIRDNGMYLWNASNSTALTTSLNSADRRNKWTHFALVSNNNSGYLYQNGIALNATAISLSSITASTITTSPNAICIAALCTNNDGASATSHFGGLLADINVTKRALYSGTSTTIANFTPGIDLSVDSRTVFNLVALPSSAGFVDLSNNAFTVSNKNAPTRDRSYPTLVSIEDFPLETTQGFSRQSGTLSSNGGTGRKLITTTFLTPGMAYYNLTDVLDLNYVIPSLNESSTAVNSTTVRVTYESITVTDASGETLTANLKTIVNPPILLTATDVNPTISAGLDFYDTVTASYGTGGKALRLTGTPVSSAITQFFVSGSILVIKVAKTAAVGTYYETVTASDFVGDRETITITITVTPGLTLASDTGSTSLTTTQGKTSTLRINAVNGSGTKTFTLTQLGATTSTGIWLNNANAASNYTLLTIADTVTAGTYSSKITVTDAQGATSDLTISITVNPALTISYNNATSGAITLTTTAGTAITSGAFTAANGTGRRDFSLSGVNSGISVDTSTSNTAYITAGSGLTALSSTAARSIAETLTVTDSVSATTFRAVTVVVNPPITLTASSLSLTTTTGVAILDTVTATYGTGNKTFSITSSPSISGITNTTNVANQTVLTIPNTVGPGNYTITVTATDSVGATSQVNIALTVNSGISITGSPALAMTTGYGFNSSPYVASNGTGAISFVLTGTLSSNFISLETITSTTFRLKVTSGAITAATYYETITATDSLGARAIFNVTLTVNPVITLSGTQSINTTFGVSNTSVYQITGGTPSYYILGSPLCAPVQTFDGLYTVMSFVAVGNCSWKVPANVSSLDYLVVGGGGGGDRGVCSIWWGHGGGGGEVVRASNYAVTPGATVTVAVGNGGSGSGSCPSLNTTPRTKGGDGGQSAFGGITAAGGKAATNTSGTGGTSGNGNPGGTPENTYPSNPSNAYVTAGYPAGGGGGAGGIGNGLNGGPGVNDSITGTTVMYGSGGAGKNDAGFGTASSGGGANSIPLPNRGGGGSDISPYSIATPGGSGIVVVRYLTPTSVDRTQLNVYTDAYLSSPGKIVVGVPDSITVGTYVETFTVTDSAASPASNTYVVTINVAKANPVLNISIPGGGSTATYGSPVSLTATANINGSVNFRIGGNTISGCGSRTTSGGVATCSWTPTDTSTVTISAVLTPLDTTNYNSVTSSNFTLSVAQADTLTVTFSNQTLTHNPSTGVNASRAFTVSGLASIDTITAVATSLIGTANDATSVNLSSSNSVSTTPSHNLTKAGTYSMTGTAVTFSGSTRLSYYKGIQYVPGVITVNRAGNTISLNYGTNNTVTYRENGTESVTATYQGIASIGYSTASSTYCSVNANTGLMTTLKAGTCDVAIAVGQSANFLGDTVTASVQINKGTRTLTLTSSANTLKYGDTTTVRSFVSAETSTAVLSLSTGSTTGCSVDALTGIITAISGTATCSLTLNSAEDDKYLVATSNQVSITLAKADAPVLTLTPPANVNFSESATSSSMPLPTFSIGGLKLDDTLTSLSGITINYIATGTYPYNSTTVPVNANVYTLTPSAITLSTGSITNYNTPTYTSVNWTISQISQETVTITSLLQEGVTVPYDVQVSGGTINGAITLAVVPGGTASGCAFSGSSLRASTTGTCIITATMAGNQNYLPRTSDSATVLIARFVSNYFDNLGSGPAGITVNSQVPITVDVVTCTADCVPTISSISPTEVLIGDPITITGTNFAGTTAVIFNRSISTTSFTVDASGTSLIVVVPANVAAGAGSVSVQTGVKISFRFSGLTFKTP